MHPSSQPFSTSHNSVKNNKDAQRRSSGTKWTEEIDKQNFVIYYLTYSISMELVSSIDEFQPIFSFFCPISMGSSQIYLFIYYYYFYNSVRVPFQ